MRRPSRAPLLSALLLGLIAGMDVPARADDAPTYTNPVWDRDFPDPHVIRHGGKYYAYATQTGGTGFQLLVSDDLVHWTRQPLEFFVPWSRDHYWAPEVLERNGTFYFTYSALDPASKKHHIAVATATHPAGPFLHQAILVRGDDNEVGVIDATIFLEEDGTPYLVYSEETPRRIVMRRLRPDLLATEGERVELLRPDQEWEKGVTEAPTVIKRNGQYHLIYSGSGFQGTRDTCRYAIGHAVAKSLAGPYTKAPQPVLATVPEQTYGPGHQGLIATPDGQWWVLYHGWNAEGEPHYGRNPKGRTLRLDRLDWDGDTPKFTGPTVTPQPAPKP